jgi:hypothetical protein
VRRAIDRLANTITATLPEVDPVKPGGGEVIIDDPDGPEDPAPAPPG